MRKALPLLVVFLSLATVLAGCGSTPGTPPPTTQPMVCSLRVQSTSPNAWGYVWVNGANTGLYLYPMGVVNVPNIPCGQTVYVQIVDEFGQQSHVETVYVSGPNTVVNFSWW